MILLSKYKSGLTANLPQVLIGEPKVSDDQPNNSVITFGEGNNFTDQNKKGFSKWRNPIFCFVDYYLFFCKNSICNAD